jgi:uncharacterized protein YjbJ (UPF0337 family)
MRGVKQQFKGLGQEAKGTLKQGVGAAVGSRRMEAEGAADRKIGRGRQAVGRGMEQAAGAAREAKGALKRDAGRVLGNPRLASEGEDERVAGRVRRRMNQQVED